MLDDSLGTGALGERYHRSSQAGILRWVVVPKSPYQCTAMGDLGVEVGKTRDGRTSVTVKMGKTRDGAFRDIYVTDP